VAPPDIANVCKFSHIGKQESDGATGPSHQWPKYHQLIATAFFVGRWLLAEQPEILMQWFAFVSLLQRKLN
jgi:hypothetical protein